MYDSHYNCCILILILKLWPVHLNCIETINQIVVFSNATLITNVAKNDFYLWYTQLWKSTHYITLLSWTLGKVLMLGKAGNRFRKGEWSLWSMRWPSVTTMRKQMLKLMERCGQNSVWLMLSDKKFSTIAAFIFHFKAKSGFKASVAEMWQLSEAESLLWNSFWINYNEKVFSGLSWHTLTRIVSAEVTWRTIFHTYKKLEEWSRSRSVRICFELECKNSFRTLNHQIK